MEKNTSKEDLLKAVADVLDEALAEYEKLAKMEGLETVEDPSRPSKNLEKDASWSWGGQATGMGGDTATNPDVASSMKNVFKEEGASPDMAETKEGEEPEDKEEVEEDEKEDEKEGEKEEEEEGDEEDEMDDETLKSQYAKMCAKMEARGLMKKSEEEVKKSEAPASEDKTETLRKSVDERFDALTKALAEISATVTKIASAPARKGVAGYQPLRKSEEGSEAQPLNKAEVIAKLLDLKKSGKYVDTALINRIETGRSSEADAQSIKQLLG